MPEVYTHGHHESVLRSHRWRTAENSAAYLLPHLKPHMRILDVGCGPGTITAGLAGDVPQGHVTGIDAAPDIVEQARELTAGRENLDFTTGDVYALDYPDDTSRGARPPGAPAPQRPGPGAARDAPGHQARRPGRRPRRATTAPWSGTRPSRSSTTGWRCTRRWPAATAGSPTPAAGCTPGPGQRAWPTSWSRRRPGRTPPQRTATGGAACGPTARSSPPTPRTPPAAATRPPRTWTGSPTAGAPGPPTPTAGSPSSTARSSAGH